MAQLFMQLSEIIHIIENIAPLDNAAEWDNSGMQIACRNNAIHSLAVCLDPEPSSIQRAIRLGARLLITHHPLLLAPRLPAKLDAFHEALSLLFRADMALYAAHTPLDAVMDGPAGWLAEALALNDICVLDPCARRDAPLRGFGCAGSLPEALLPARLFAILAEHISLDGARLSGPHLKNDSLVRRVAYCPGSGSSLVQAAAAAGADIFITGDVKYHDALNTPLPLLDVGHHALEEEMTRRLALLLRERLHGVDVRFIPSTNPMRPVMPAGACNQVLENPR